MSTTDPVTAPRGTKTKVVAIVVVLIAFLGGIAIGAIGDRIWLLHRGPSHRNAHAITERVLHKLDDELELSPEQRQRVKQILEAHAARMQQIGDTVRPQIRQEIDQNNAEIERVLTPDQRAKFDKLKMQLTPRHMRHS
ncbi:MAG TPA: hypothetical protein VJ901_01685 [Thermoanaerobaculia bacterium]|nr:hypothetical protein [Thermoanaerobaculia bacterium]